MDTVRNLLELASTVLADHWLLVLSLLGLVIVGILIYRWRAEFQYLLFKWWTGFPGIGRIARYARQDQKRVPDPDGGEPWYLSERDLCAGYYRFYTIADKDANFFDKCANYLNKIEERGRKPIGFGLWFLIVVFVLAEIFVFAMVLAPFVANNISADDAKLSAIFISVVAAGVLVFGTHFMGAELHKNGLIKKARYWHKHHKNKHNAKKLEPSHKIDLDHTELDDEEPNYLHIINRVKTNPKVKPGYWATGATVAFIVLIAVGSYLIRASTLKELETDQANPSPYASLSVQAGDDWPFSTVRGGETGQDSPQADQRTAEEIIAARIAGYKTTFVIMSVLFIFVQIVCIFIAHRHALAGIASKEAVRRITGFDSRSEFSAWYKSKRERVAQDADEHLNRLQEAIAGQDDLGGSDEEENHQHHSFMHYVRERKREQEAEHGTAAAGAEPSSPVMEPSVPAHTASVEYLPEKGHDMPPHARNGA